MELERHIGDRHIGDPTVRGGARGVDISIG